MSSGTPTPNLGLNTFDTLDDMQYDEVNFNFTELDGKLPMFACTSTTRPTTSLYNNRLIKESDTGNVMRYDLATTSWKLVAAGKHQDWSPQWQTGGSQLAIGNGTEVAKKWQQGDIIHFDYFMQRGSTTNLGGASQDYQYILPAAAPSFPLALGTGFAQLGAGVPTPIYLHMVSSSVFVLARMSDGVRLQNNATFPWATNDRIYFRGSMRAAASID